MSNVLLGWPIYSDVGVSFSPALSGGSWVATLPLTNLQDRRLAKVARSTNALAASTQFDVDLGTARAVFVVAIPKHSMTSAGTVRVRGFASAAHSGVQYDSGAITPFPTGLTAEDVAGLNVAFRVFPAGASARYWFIELTDTANPAGYVDVARIVIAGGYQPAINMDYGAVLGLETETERKVTDGGAALYNVRPMRRTLTFTLDQVAEAEAYSSIFNMSKQLGISGQLFVCYNPGDAHPGILHHQRDFLAVFRQPTLMQHLIGPRHNVPFSLVEEL